MEDHGKSTTDVSVTNFNINFEGIGFLNNFRVIFTGISSACLICRNQSKIDNDDNGI